MVTALLTSTDNSSACFAGLMPLARVPAAAAVVELPGVLVRPSSSDRMSCQGVGEWSPRAGQCASAKAAIVAVLASLLAVYHC
jgi:hypothetical protein